jgi:hypothetical protein
MMYLVILGAILAAVGFAMFAMDAWMLYRSKATAATLICGCVASLIVLTTATIHQVNANHRDADRKVEECIAAGGTPDVYGRNGTLVRCHGMP